MMHVHSEALSKLLCTHCKQYLSYFPIYSNSGGENFCGRCRDPILDLTRNEIYETIAEKQKFPCRFSSEGCFENLIPKEILVHEQYCTKKYHCPMITNPECKWAGRVKDLIEHFEQNHPTFSLKEGRFEIDLINNNKDNYLLPFGEDLYVVYQSTDSISNKFSCSVRHVAGNPFVSNYSFKLTMENNNKSQRHQMIEKLNGTIEITSEYLRCILNDPVSIITQIEIVNGDLSIQTEEPEYIHEDLNYELLENLECLVCMNYMVPPIYQCITGHSICYGCKTKVRRCPTCKQKFKETQNFTLAQVVQHFEYPCRHSKCRFKAKPKDIKQHEATCPYGPFTCPLKQYLNCNALMIFSEIYDHLLNNHYENLMEYETITIPFDKYDAVVNCFILKYGSKLFKQNFFFNTIKNNFRWSMELIGPENEVGNYKFEIDIIDTKEGNLRYYFKMPCSPLNDMPFVDDDNQDGYYIDYAQIESLIGNELSYRVRIIG